MAEHKRYLGDGVYVDVDDLTRGCVLTTEDGVHATNRIVLEPEVISAFEKWLAVRRAVVARMRGESIDGPTEPTDG